MTTVNIKVRNPATKKDAIVSRFKATYKRKHGRPRNVGKHLKVRRLPLEQKPRLVRTVIEP